ncbi:MAG: hypothetical protein CM1200mP27_06190 [Chloroflexota bacterium]|nr:MAG: hypothetical protein CM1200mP27_06190 [Chloroflexota bacterium]
MLQPILLTRETLMPNLNDRRFDWSYLTPLTPHLPATGGQVRSELDDFVVTEIPKYLPNGKDLMRMLLLRKAGTQLKSSLLPLKHWVFPSETSALLVEKINTQ